LRARLVIIIVAAFFAGGLGALGLYALLAPQGGGNPQVVSGKALIGGPFTLTDHTGKRVTNKDFEGKFMLVYFGYTYCPDVCPAELQVMSAAIDQLGEKGKKVTPVVVSIDPERDTVAQLNTYVANFHPRLVGLTGTPEEVRAAAKAFRVYYAKAKSESASDYLMDHSSIVYLMSPKGEYLAHFPYGTDVDKMAEGIAKFL
jgi:cytochrome oxidase Cu insertion factor (SCO1/SenC/PrrC family)